MVPKSMLRRSEAGEAVCAHCVALFALLDEEQGDRGRPWRGRNKMAKVTGWPRDTVTQHVGHLVDRGLVTVEQDGQTMAVYYVANPARPPSAHRSAVATADRPVDSTPPIEVDSTPPRSGQEAAHLDADCGQEAAHRSRSERSESGLPSVLHSESENTEEDASCVGCGDVADAPRTPGGNPWCLQCEPF